MMDISNKEKFTLILITGSYPYETAAEQTFLDPEIKVLVRNFERVVVVPELCAGQRCQVPQGVQIEEEYARLRQSTGGKVRAFFRSLRSLLLYKEIASRPATLWQPFSLKRLFRFVNGAELAKRWVSNFIKQHRLEETQLIFYTFWLDASSLGLGLAKQNHPGIVLVSRAHGYDLYEWRSPNNYIPCRKESLKSLDGLFPDSEAGRQYITGRYPWFKTLCQTARLGVSDPDFITAPSTDGVFRIVSCSFVVPVKRVDLLMEGIALAAKQRPGQHFSWHHIGTGPLREKIATVAQATMPSNARSYFPGYTSPKDLMQFYRDTPADLFVNVSVTEGTPIAVMEAISCGIPILATAVGGNPEIVSEHNGKLLSADPSPAEIAAAILDFLDNPVSTLEKREGSRRMWHDNYNAEVNFQTFADQLKSIRTQGSTI